MGALDVGENGFRERVKTAVRRWGQDVQAAGCVGAGAGGGGGTEADFSRRGDIRASDQPWQGWSHFLKSSSQGESWGTLRDLPLGAEGQGLCLGLGAEERRRAALRRSC